jgi:hypothetical protein
MLDKNALERLYTSYGFEVVESKNENISIFVYKKSRYFGVDIVPLLIGDEIAGVTNQIKDEYSKSGYAVNVKWIKTIDDAEIELFKSFFNFDTSSLRIEKKYKDFTKKQQLGLIGNPYQYVESPFELHNHQDDEKMLFEIIDKRLSSGRPELIIIEAAAGYGKTCTAFEILSKIVSKQINQLPIFTELSRNRSANIFRYILLDEIDLEFPSLSSSLVIKEIKNGRIPLIIDGFDELLEKVDSEVIVDNSFEDVESMLDTIGNLLDHKAKIILTTRKTAIFTGLEFEAWLNKWADKFDLTRIALKEPRIKDWIGDERYVIVKEKNVPIQNLANPVLLTFLKHQSIDAFRELTDNPDKLIVEFFDKMLTREMERQDLIMSVDNQIKLFKNVARNLLELDSTVEEKEFFKMIILEDNKKLLEETRNLYPSANKRTIDNLLDTLSTHALLDRKGRDQNQIGFLNDFVFGTFIGEILIECSEELDTKRYSNYMIEMAITAYRVQNLTRKDQLWNKVQAIVSRFNSESIFLIDMYLKEILVRDYEGMTLTDNSFFNVKFVEHKLSSTVFLNCYFKNCDFDSCVLQGVTFIGCTFSNCTVKDDLLLDKDNEITTIKCVQEKCAILLQRDSPLYSKENSPVTELERSILQKLWDISHTKGHHISKLVKSFDRSQTKKVNKSLKSLEEAGFLEIRGIHIYFAINKTADIKKIIGA